jgi:hypothetical protein
VAVVVVIVALAAGGGSDDNGSTGANAANDDSFPPHVVRNSEIEAQGAGSPQRALLEWWQSFQFGDATGLAKHTSPATISAIGEHNLAELVKLRGKGLQGIEVLGVTVDGNTASVRAGLLTFQPKKQGEPPPDTPTASRPATFAMAKQGDEWLFRETAFLRPMIEGLRQRRQQKPKQGNQQQQTETQSTQTTP